MAKEKFDGTAAAAARVIEAELEGSPRMSGKQALARLNELVAETPTQAAPESKYGDGDLPHGLVVKEGGSLLNWQGENYVPQSALADAKAAAKAKAKAPEPAPASDDKAIMAATLNALADKLDERPLVTTTQGKIARQLRKEAAAIAGASD